MLYLITENIFLYFCSMRYSLQPHSLGRIVSGLDLKAAISQDVIKQLVNDVTEHRLLIFKNQGVVAPERQLEIRYNVLNLQIQMAIIRKEIGQKSCLFLYF